MKIATSKICVLGICAFLALGAVSFSGSAGGQGAKWTFAIYMCSDNDLDE